MHSSWEPRNGNSNDYACLLLHERLLLFMTYHGYKLFVYLIFLNFAFMTDDSVCGLLEGGRTTTAFFDRDNVHLFILLLFLMIRSRNKWRRRKKGGTKKKGEEERKNLNL